MIHYNLPMEDYLASPAIGSSSLKNIMLTPADYKAARERVNSDTKATALGTAVHTLILEPEEFCKRYALQPEDWGPKNQGEGRKKWDAFKKENEGKKVIGFEDTVFLEGVAKACQGHHELESYRKIGKSEVTAFASYCDLFDLKARGDLVCPRMLLDVKTTSESVDDDNLFRIVFNNGYHFQAAHHMFVFNQAIYKNQKNPVPITDFGWIFVSTKTPAVHIRLVKAPQELLDWAKKDHAYALEKLTKCLHNDSWEGYSKNMTDLQIPEWARKLYE